MDMEGIHAADAAQSVTGQGADGTGKPTGSSAPGLPSPDPESLLTEPARSPDPESALPARKPPQNPQNPQNLTLSPNVARKPPSGRERDEARKERINEADQAARDGGSSLPECEEARRNRR